MRSIYMVFITLIVAACASQIVSRRPAEAIGEGNDYTTTGGTLAEKPEYVSMGDCHPYSAAGDLAFGIEFKASGKLQLNPVVQEMDAMTKIQYANLAYVLQLEKPVYIQLESLTEACRIDQLTLDMDRSQFKAARNALSSGRPVNVKGISSLPLTRIEIMNNGIVREAVFTP